MKSLFIIALALVTMTQAMAERMTIELTGYVKVYTGAIHPADHFGTFLPGNRFVIDSQPVRDFDGNRAVRVQRVLRPHAFANPQRSDNAMYINQNSMYEDFLITVGDMRSSIVLRGQRPSRPSITPVTPIRPTRPTFDVVYDQVSYERCYSRPYSRYVVVDEEQRRQGRVATGVGLGLGVIGALIGGDEGAIVAGAGAIIGIAGLVQINQATDRIFEVGYDCKKYYKTERRYVRIQSRQCTTTRYYTTGWNGRVSEYFETSCGSDSYMSFRRNGQIWY